MSPLRSLAAALALACAAAACTRDVPRQDGARTPAASAPVSATDASGRTVTLAHPAQRVISLVPSGTDLLVAAGAAPKLVGRTDNDRSPEVAALPSVGGFDFSLETIVSLRPDLVVVWHATSSPVLRERLEAQGIRTYALETRDTATTFAGLAGIGRLMGMDSAAGALAGRIRGELARVAAQPEADTPSVFFVVNVTPPMTNGPGTFMAQLAEVAGGRTAFPELKQDWAQVSLEELVRRQPDWLVVSVGEEGDRAKRVGELRASAGWRELRAVREGRVIALPSELLSRPGPRLGETARLLRAAIHP